VGAGTSRMWSVGYDAGFFGLVSNNEAERTLDEAPMVFDGGVWNGTRRGVSFHNLPGNGTVGGSNKLAGTNPVGGCCEFFGPITNGTNVYASQKIPAPAASTIFVFNGARTAQANLTLAAAANAMPTIGIDGRIYTADTASELLSFSPANQTQTAVIGALPGNLKVPLQGSDGHLYLPRESGFLYALEGSQISWTFDPLGNIFRGGLLDCAGRLFTASDGTVFAFVTDDHGLADTPWPSIRRDSRNTGNASALKYGIRTSSGCTQ
jgi:hypothetical protein